MEFSIDELRVIMRALSKFARTSTSQVEADVADDLFYRVDKHRDELIMKEQDGTGKSTD